MAKTRHTELASHSFLRAINSSVNPEHAVFQPSYSTTLSANIQFFVISSPIG